MKVLYYSKGCLPLNAQLHETGQYEQLRKARLAEKTFRPTRVIIIYQKKVGEKNYAGKKLDNIAFHTVAV